MEILQTIFLALVQGVTEFLPISSSAHLILPFDVFGWQDQGLPFDVAVHLGTLVAVVSYFWRDLWKLLLGLSRTLQGKTNTDGTFAINLVIASLPIVIVGFLLKALVAGELRSTLVIAISTIVFGLVLFAADKLGSRTRSDQTLNASHSLLIGLAQCLALIPGTSRSGITISAALALGYQRQAASRISFLMAVPTILGASTLLGLDLLQTNHGIDWQALGLGVFVSAITAYICIHYFLTLIERIGFLPFVIYRLLLGGGLLVFIWL